MRRLPIGLLSCAIAVGAVPCHAADDFKTEPGFAMLFNGKNLDGWKLKKDGSKLDGKTEAAGGRFKVMEGKLILDPKVSGDIIIETAKEFAGDLTIRFEYKPGKGCNNDLFLRGTKFDIKTPDVKNLKEGEWNAFEIVLKGESAEFKNNGEAADHQDPGREERLWHPRRVRPDRDS